MIANSGHDENGKYWGGKAGDQTGTQANEQLNTLLEYLKFLSLDLLYLYLYQKYLKILMKSISTPSSFLETSPTTTNSPLFTSSS